MYTTGRNVWNIYKDSSRRRYVGSIELIQVVSECNLSWNMGQELTSLLASDLIALSLRQIYRNRRRYKGVVIGIALGLAGLVTVLTMGNSVETDLGSNLELLGTATILKATWDFDRSERWHHGSYSQKDIDDLRRLPGVAGATPVVWIGYAVASQFEHRAENVRLLGVEPAFHWICHVPVAVGRPINEEDVKLRKSVCVIGQNMHEESVPREQRSSREANSC